MSEYFKCKVCDKSIKIKSKKNHLNSLNQKSLSMSILSRYSVESPDFLHIEKAFKNSVLDYNKKFYLIICKWKLHFSHTIVNVESPTCYSFYNSYYLK